MITTVTLNPCIDRSVRVKSLQVGGHNRISYARTDLGGKGINVSVVARHMDAATRALCFDYMDSGTFLSDALFSMGIEGALVPVPGRLRENMKLYDAQSGQMTEINDPGTPVDQSTLSRLLRRFDLLLKHTDVIVLSGSVPPGVSEDLYAELIRRAKKNKVFTVLDAAGEPLRLGIKAGPDLIKPNRYEMEMLSGCALNTRQEMHEEIVALLNQGVGAVCLSLGEEGAIYQNNKGAWYAKGVAIDVKGVQGAGDSLVAGLCIGHMQGKDEGEMLRMGVTLAQGSLLREGTQLCTREQYEELLPKITAERII